MWVLGNMSSDSQGKLCPALTTQLFDRIIEISKENELDVATKSLFMHILQNVIKAKPAVFTYLQVNPENFFEISW